MASNPFTTHHAAAGKAFSAGDHAKAMHHIGHMMMAVRGAAKATTGAPEGPTAAQSGTAAQAGSDDDTSDALNPLGVSTPAPQPAKQHFFGQVAHSTPKAKPHTAPPSQLGATNHSVSGGFNKSRFSGLKGR